MYTSPNASVGSLDPADDNDTLHELALEYADQLEETLVEIEALVVGYGRTGKMSRDLVRHVHSMKGTGASFGLQIVTTICHQFEDQIEEQTAGVTPGALPSSSIIDRYLKYVDLLRSTRVAFLNKTLSGEQKRSKFANIIEALNLLTGQGRLKILIADESRSLISMVGSSLSGSKVSITHVQDGLVALTRVLMEPFDLLVASKHLRTLDGRGVFAAIKLSGRRDLPMCVLLTSDMNDPLNRKCGADEILEKSQFGFTQLQDLVKKRAKK
jgi:CheY-like chemotaxis protein/HPt (histidine-containing phosphotransfer) domain-containing protein